MKKLMVALILVFAFSAISVEAAPKYAKWGAIAVKETQKRYNANIIDYRHMGRIKITASTFEEKFKLWLRNKDGTEFGVYVYIQFDPATDIIKSIRFSETHR